MQPYDSHQWVNIATAGIVSPKERQSARQELLDHMEDHAEALMSTGLPRSRALEQAVAAMGDPKTVGKHLRRAHQPVLTRLLQGMRAVLITLVCLFALRAMICVINRDPPLPLWIWGNPQNAVSSVNPFRIPPETAQQDLLLARRVVHPHTRTQIGDYTVTVHSAAVSQYEGGYSVDVILDFTAASLLQDEPVFTQHLLLQAGAEDVHAYPDPLRLVRNLHHHYIYPHQNKSCTDLYPALWLPGRPQPSHTKHPVSKYHHGLTDQYSSSSQKEEQRWYWLKYHH